MTQNVRRIGWLAVACVVLAATSPLSAQQPRLKWSIQGKAEETFAGAFNPDGKTLASAGRHGRIRLWDAAAGKNTVNLEGHTAAVLSLAFSPDGKTLASASSDESVKLWDVATGKNTATL